MSHDKRFYVFICAVFCVGLACSFPGVVIPDANVISTAAAQTVIAGLTQALPLETSSPVFELTLTLPAVLESPLPTMTLTQTLTSTPYHTPTSSIPLISVSVDTNCRVGPGQIYVRVGGLLVGETAEVYGRDPTNRYWYIRNPDARTEFCWLWGEYATVVGPYQNLPVFTPPPTPTFTATSTPTVTPTSGPNFTLQYEGMDLCSGWWLEVRVKNTGSLPFRSLRFKIKDTVTGTEFVDHADDFKNLDGCLKVTTKDRLLPGEEFIISSPIFGYDPSGNKMRVMLTLCTQASQNGHCLTQKIFFNP